MPAWRAWTIVGSGKGATGDRFRDESHPYSDDLDLFGKGSLFQLLSTARTRPGEEMLASWLLARAPVEELRARQQAIDELRPMLDLREDLAVLGAAWGPRSIRRNWRPGAKRRQPAICAVRVCWP